MLEPAIIITPARITPAMADILLATGTTAAVTKDIPGGIVITPVTRGMLPEGITANIPDTTIQEAIAVTILAITPAATVTTSRHTIRGTAVTVAIALVTTALMADTTITPAITATRRIPSDS